MVGTGMQSDKAVFAITRPELAAPDEQAGGAETRSVTCRYANLLREGADEFQLNAQYRAWLRSLPTVSSESKRGDKYWTGLDGQPMKMYPRIWKGSEGSSHR